MKIEQRVIDPALAAEWLATSRGNRTLSRGRVGALVSAIQAGQWAVSPDAIAFAGQHLANGHHRLTACVEAGRSISAIVQWLSDEEATESWRLATDNGRPRSLTDQTTCVGGDRIPPAVVSALSVAIMRGKTTHTQPRAKIMAAWREHRDLAISAVCNNKSGVAHRAPVAGACIRACWSGAITRKQLERFMELLANPAMVADPAAESAPLVMIATAARNKNKAFGIGKSHPGGGMQSALYLLTCAALVKFAAGEKCTRLTPMAACPFHVSAIDGENP